MATESEIADARRDFERSYRMFYGGQTQWITANAVFQSHCTEAEEAINAEREKLNELGGNVQRMGEQAGSLWLAYMQLKEPAYGAGNVATMPQRTLQEVASHLREVPVTVPNEGIKDESNG